MSEEEAAKCKANLERWSKEDVVYPKQSKIGLGDWIFRDVSVARQGDEIRQNLTQILKHENSVALNTQGDSLLIVSENGLGKRTSIDEFKLQNRLQES